MLLDSHVFLYIFLNHFHFSKSCRIRNIRFIRNCNNISNVPMITFVFKHYHYIWTAKMCARMFCYQSSVNFESLSPFVRLKFRYLNSPSNWNALAAVLYFSSILPTIFWFTTSIVNKSAKEKLFALIKFTLKDLFSVAIAFLIFCLFVSIICCRNHLLR